MNDRPRLGRRTFNGVAMGRSVTLDARSSLLIVGPTQVGKTSSLVIPSILRWSDALVVTSVKNDVIATTKEWRRTLGEVQILEPGRDGGTTWNPLEGVATLRHALRVARDLTFGSSDRGDTEFWNALATKLVGAMFMFAFQLSRTVFDVAATIEKRDFDSWLRHGRGEAADVVEAFLSHDPKTLDGVLTTAETMMMPWRFAQPLARVRSVVGGPNTLYLCSPRGEQRHYEPLFRGALRMILEEQQRLVDLGCARRLLLVLDEAATVASLDELDQMASTVSGLGVTLVTVLQDFSQLKARWGPRASTIVNNHTTRLIMGGLADPSAAQYLPELLETRKDA
ncbi:MAG: type IV secretory system conjugative DNA transfer family protein, partial [Acidimicrobiales bacterium]